MKLNKDIVINPQNIFKIHLELSIAYYFSRQDLIEEFTVSIVLSSLFVPQSDKSAPPIVFSTTSFLFLNIRRKGNDYKK